MGYRLHSATRYEVKYSAGDFNHQCEEIHNLLSSCGAEYTGDCYDSEFEVSRNDWEKVIEELKNLDSLQEEEKDEIMEAIGEMKCTLKNIIEGMEFLLKESDPNNDFLHLSYF